MPPKILAIACFIVASTPALSHAENACGATGFEPTLSGFSLNPKLDKLTVTYAKPAKPGDVCPLQAKDEILQVNEQVVPGSRALAAMRYWKSIKEGSLITYKVKRNGTTLRLSAK